MPILDAPQIVWCPSWMGGRGDSDYLQGRGDLNIKELYAWDQLEFLLIPHI